MNKEDIEVGVVISFICDKIDSCIKKGQIQEISRNYGLESELEGNGRPFVCIGHHAGCSQWAEITTIPRKERLAIDINWRTWQTIGHNCYQSNQWKKRDQYIHGAVFWGDDNIWVSISNDLASSGCYRMITADGITAIRKKLAPELKSPLFD